MSHQYLLLIHLINTNILTPTHNLWYTHSTGITPMDAVPIFEPLEAARRTLILTTGFHLVFLVTPPHTSITPNWQKFEEILSRLFAENKAIEEVCEYIGVRMSRVQQFRQRPPDYTSIKPEDLFYKRVYSAIILFKLTEETPLADLGADLLLPPSSSSHGAAAGRGNSTQTGATYRSGEHGRIQVTHPHLPPQLPNPPPIHTHVHIVLNLTSLQVYHLTLYLACNLT